MLFVHTRGKSRAVSSGGLLAANTTMTASPTTINNRGLYYTWTTRSNGMGYRHIPPRQMRRMVFLLQHG